MTQQQDFSEERGPRRLRAVEGAEAQPPAPRLPEQQHPPHNNLPLTLSTFIGRELEVAEVKRLVGQSRLVTLTGAGGSGKARLGLAVAHEVVESFEAGAWWVGLAPLFDPDLVPQAVASALGVREAPGPRTPTEALVEDLKTKELLLILDNCEHLIDACAALADALLHTCPNLKILATSREALGVAGEVSWPVPSLSLPNPERLPSVEDLERYEAVQLFVERAKATTSGFELTEENTSAVAQLCRSFEGIPLAIELAAARIKVLSAGQSLERLEESLKLLAGTDRTAPERQKTLRGALDWSYQLLSEQERKLFWRLSLFAGGWTLEAAEAVGAGAGIEGDDVLDLLTRLVDKSLVVVEAGVDSAAVRYRMLEPLRQYGQERLEQGGEAEQVRERHAKHFLALAEEAEPELREQEAWLKRLEREHANFRAALSWALDEQDAQQPEEGRAELGLRLTAALAQGRFWNAYGPNEGRRWLERALAESSGAPTPSRAKALKEAGWLANFQGDYHRSVALLEESMALFEELGDKPGLAAALFYLGMTVVHGRDRERTRALCEAAEALRRELSDRQAIGSLLIFLGIAALNEGDHDRSVALTEEALALNRETDDMRGTAMCLTILGMTALERGDAERAASLYGEEMRLLRGLRDKLGTAYGLRGMAGVAALRGNAARAGRLWGAVEALQEAIGLPLSPFDRSHPDYESLVAAARSQLDEATWEAALAEGRRMTPGGAIEYALSQEGPTQQKETTLLSERELEILSLVAEGMTDSQVASRLYLSPRTVSFHLRSIYRKLDVPSRAAAARAAVERSLI